MAMLLTELAVEKLKPGSVRREVADARLTGLYLIVQPSGSKAWALRYRYAGRSRKLTLGKYPSVGVAKARERAADALEALSEGRDPATEKRVAFVAQNGSGQDRDSFGIVVRAFIVNHARPNNRSWKETARLLGLKFDVAAGLFVDIKGGLTERWSERQIDTITRREIIEFLDVIAVHTPISANRMLAALRKLANWAVNRDILPASFCYGVKPPAAEIARDRVLSDDEIRWLWRAVEMDGYPFAPLVQLLLLTGQRRQEVALMRYSEIDLEHRVWRLGAERTKNGRPHLVPLSDPCVAILETLPRFAGCDYVFSGSGRTAFSGFSKSLGRAKARMCQMSDADISHWTLHDLRRTAATGMASLGVSPHVIEAALNHVSGAKASVAGVYNRYHFNDEKRSALDAWAAHVVDLVAPPNTSLWRHRETNHGTR